MNKLLEWINSELDVRGWSYNELARRADLSGSTVSNVMAERFAPGLDFCRGVARAFDVPPENVLRIAGLLPSEPPETTRSRRAMAAFTRLDAAQQQSAIAMLEGLAGRTAPAVPEPEPETDVLASWDLNGETLELISAARVTDQQRAAYRTTGPRPPDIPPLRWWLAGLLGSLLERLPPEDVDAVFDEMKRIRDRLGANTGEPSAEENTHP